MPNRGCAGFLGVWMALYIGSVFAAEQAPPSAVVPGAYAYESRIDLVAPRAEVLALLSDIDLLSRWLFLSESAYLIDGDVDASRAWVHLFLKQMLGQPAQDAVLLASVSQSRDLKTVSIRLRADPDRLLPVEGYRRIRELEVAIDAETLQPDRTRVRLAVRVVPGVPVPLMAQPFLGMGPQLSLGYMQQLLASGRYRDADAVLSTPRARAFYRDVVLR